MNAKAGEKIAYFVKALGRLKDALSVTDESVRADVIIQRFEFTYELAWKALKTVLEMYGHVTASPRDAFKSAYSMGWIDNEEFWIEMMRVRNLTTHTYDEKLAKDVSSKIPDFIEKFEHLSHILNEKTESAS